MHRWRQAAESRDSGYACYGSLVFEWYRLAHVCVINYYEMIHFTQVCDPIGRSWVILTKRTPSTVLEFEAKIQISTKYGLCGLFSSLANVSSTPEIAVTVRRKRDNWKCLFWITHDNNVISLSGCLDWGVIKGQIPGGVLICHGQVLTAACTHLSCHSVTDCLIIQNEYLHSVCLH